MAIKILLADDSLTIQKVVELTFSDAETRLMAVGSGDRAVQALDAFQPDIVLADVVMPGLTGYDVCDTVKQRPGGAFVPVVLLTGTFEPFDRARAERVGSDAIVTKPFDSHALQGLVRDLVTRARAAREDAEAAALAAPPPVPEPPPTMILSAAELEGVLTHPVPPAEDTGATQSMPALTLSEALPSPSAEEEWPMSRADASYRTIAMRIPTAAELAAAAPVGTFEPPPPPPPFFEPEPVSLAPPPPSPFYRPDLVAPVEPPPLPLPEPEPAAVEPPPAPFDVESQLETEAPPPPSFHEVEPAFEPPPPPPPPAFYEPEREFGSAPPPPPPPSSWGFEPAFVPPPPPPPPAFYEPEVPAASEALAPFEIEMGRADEPFVEEAESSEPLAPEMGAPAPFEAVVEPEPESASEEVGIAFSREAIEAVPVETAATDSAEFELPAEEFVPQAAEPGPAAAVAEEEPVEPFPEMDEPAQVAEAETAPWDEGPEIEIPPPPPELSGGPEDTDGTEPVTRDLVADLEAFEASGKVRRRPEIWERHAALIGEETPADIDVPGVDPVGVETPPMVDPTSSELEEMAAAARIEDLSALLPSATVPAMAVAAAVPAPDDVTPPGAETTAPLGSVPGSALSDADVDRIARRLVQLLSDKVVRDIAWEVVPEYAERLVRERIAEVERAG